MRMMCTLIVFLFAFSAARAGELLDAISHAELKPSAVAMTTATRALSLYVGEARVLNQSNVKRVAVGNGRTLNTSILDGQQVLVLAEQEGQSTIHIWHRDGSEEDYAVTVVSADAGRLLGEINTLIAGNPKVSAHVVGDKIILEGNDLGDEQTARLTEIIRRYPQIVNLMSRVGLERMVQTDVRIMEFRKSALRQLGIRWQNSNIKGPSFGVVGDFKRSGAFTSPPAGSGIANVEGIPVRDKIAPFATYFGIESAITSMINLAVNKGDATFLAEPRLTCKSGSTAKFLSGGEIPIPTVGGFGQVSVQFKSYGVKLEVEPVVSESSAIRIKAFTELSAVDSSVTVQGIPGFITRRTETEVNLQPDETLVISGLFDGGSDKSLDKIPGIGDIPVLGELFRSREFRRSKTDLVIFLTPHVIRADSASNQEAVNNGNHQRDDFVNGLQLAQ
jgi:pilus assembly protein CpaC